MSKASALANALGAIADRVAGQGEKSATVLRMQAETRRIQNGASALVRAQTSRSPLDTPEAHVKKIGTMARKFDQEALATFNRSTDFWRSGMADIARRIEEKINLKPDAFAAEIRAAYRGMKPQDRVGLIGRLIKENRGPELAALIKAPASLTGLSDLERSKYEAAMLSAHAPDELEERARLEEDLEATAAALRAAGDLAKSLTDPGELARIEMQVAASRAAGDEFNQALAPE